MIEENFRGFSGDNWECVHSHQCKNHWYLLRHHPDGSKEKIVTLIHAENAIEAKMRLEVLTHE